MAVTRTDIRFDEVYFDENVFDQRSVFVGTTFQPEIYIHPTPKEIYFTDIEEEITFEGR